MSSTFKKVLIFTSLFNVMACSPTDDTGVNLNSDMLAICDVSHTDSYYITDLAVVDGLLNIDVGYSGGCESHDWELCWNGDIAESAPVQVFLSLGHNANGDSCEMEKGESLSFDISILDDVEKPTTIVISGTDVTYGEE